MRKIALLLLLGILILGFNKRNFYKVPPIGTVKIDDNLFMDNSEITNMYWREYRYWMGRIYGDSSAEHLSSFPNETVWNNEYSCLGRYADYYLGHPAYNDQPVVGITQQQAKDYCKWRSDRVFEVFLIKKGIIDHNFYQSRNNHFSINNYFEGKYNKVTPNPHLIKYPSYRLPTEEEWKKAKAVFKLQYPDKIKNCNSKQCRLHVKNKSLPNAVGIIPCSEEKLLEEPTTNVVCIRNWKVGLYMDGNVSEWLVTSNQYIGSNWRDSTHHQSDSVRFSDSATDNIGLRCVCEWKEYNF